MPNSFVQSQIPEDPEFALMDQGSSSNVPSSTAEKFESNLKEAAEIIRMNKQREDPGGIQDTDNYDSSFANEVTESVARGETLGEQYDPNFDDPDSAQYHKFSGDSRPDPNSAYGDIQVPPVNMNKLIRPDSQIKTTERNPLEMQDSTIREDKGQVSDTANRLM